MPRHASRDDHERGGAPIGEEGAERQAEARAPRHAAPARRGARASASTAWTLSRPARWPAPTAMNTVPGRAIRSRIQPAQVALRSARKMRRSARIVAGRIVEHRLQPLDVAARPGGERRPEHLRQPRQLVQRRAQHGRAAAPRECRRAAASAIRSFRAGRSDVARPRRGGQHASPPRSRPASRAAERAATVSEIDAYQGSIGSERRAPAAPCRSSARSSRSFSSGDSRDDSGRPCGSSAIARDHRRDRRRVLRLDRLQHQLARGVERGPHLVVEPGPAVQHVEGAEQIDGRVLVAHHPERRIGVGQRSRRLGGSGRRPAQRLRSERRGKRERQREKRAISAAS